MPNRQLNEQLSRRSFLGAMLAAWANLSAGIKADAVPANGGMPTRILGRTNEKVSLIGLGGFHAGDTGSEAESIQITRRAIDSGITFLDNCWSYHNGVAEDRMGKALRDGYRNKVFLMTKIDGRTKKAAREQIDQCLQRLRTDHIDLMQIHEVIRMTDGEEIFAPGMCMEALLEAKKAGKIRYIGFTGHKSPAIHLKALEVAARNKFVFDAVQLPLNVMDAHFDSFEKLVLPRLVEQNIGVLGMKSLGAGLILQSRTVSAIECLQYAMSLHTGVVITGIQTMRDLDQALLAARTFAPLTAAQRNALLSRTAEAAAKGRYELYKTTYFYDGTRSHPEWLGKT